MFHWPFCIHTAMLALGMRAVQTVKKKGSQPHTALWYPGKDIWDMLLGSLKVLLRRP